MNSMEIHMITKTSGMMPKKPLEVVVMMEVMLDVESLRAVGEKSEKTPIRQMRKKRT